jgi:hypothetical protein
VQSVFLSNVQQISSGLGCDFATQNFLGIISDIPQLQQLRSCDDFFRLSRSKPNEACVKIINELHSDFTIDEWKVDFGSCGDGSEQLAKVGYPLEQARRILWHPICSPSKSTTTSFRMPFDRSSEAREDFDFQKTTFDCMLKGTGTLICRDKVEAA